MVRRIVGMMVVLAALGSAGAAAQGQGQPAAPAKGTAQPAQVVNLNTATAAQIATLPGIGEKSAQRIIEYREKNGGFKKIEELMNVKGIGEKSFLKLKPMITVGEKPAPRQ